MEIYAFVSLMTILTLAFFVFFIKISIHDIKNNSIIDGVFILIIDITLLLFDIWIIYITIFN